WLPTLDQAANLEERMEWLSLCQEILDGTCERFTSTDDDDSHGTPYPWDRWVFDRVATLILDMTINEQPQVYWEKILSIGPIGHYWIEDFFLSWFRRGLAAGSPQSFVCEWRRLAERAFTLPQWNLEEPKNALQFAAFLRLPATDGIRLDGILWLDRHSPQTDKEYWGEYNIQDIVAELLDKCWMDQRSQLRR